MAELGEMDNQSVQNVDGGKRTIQGIINPLLNTLKTLKEQETTGGTINE